MVDDSRPDPDALLRVVEKEQSVKGKLKVFFGMAAGVGKTFSMLKEGRQKKEEGVDVVIGYLESHQRKETDELATGMEIVPRMTLDYRGKMLQEMDLDAVLLRRPGLVLVDELAHTNAPGARNRKRYQDVLELIDHGIDVFTTVNVQHLEGFADTVEEITGITITERIPDSVFDTAETVVLIDISPEGLLERLAEGKVYLGERAQSAAENFFKKSTLTALREMALRHTALLVTHQLATYAQEHSQQTSALSGERLLVAISPSPNSAHLIRWTRQRAFNLKAEWTVLYVEIGAPLAETAQESLRKNMNLARSLGAAVVTIPSDNVSLAVIRYARANSITEIVVGKSGFIGRARLFRKRSIAENLLRMSGDIDVAVVQEKGANLSRPRVTLSSYLRPERASIAKMLLAVGVVTGISLLALPVIGYRSVSILYLLSVIGVAFFANRISVLVAAGLSALLWDFFFIPPRFTFSISKLEDVLMFFLFFVTAAALAFLMSRIRANQQMLSVRARRLSLLLNFSQALSVHHTLSGIVLTGLEYISRYIEADMIVFLRDETGGLERTARTMKTQEIDEKEFGVARWCFDSRTPCGKYTDTLHMARFHYIPLLTPDSAVGVLGISLGEGQTWLKDHEDSLQMLGRSLAVSIERELLSEENRRNLMARESERLGRVLLNTVSHELRTPLTAIKGSITALMDASTAEDPETRGLLLSETLTATDRLNAIVENLLSMSRLESGMLRLKKSETDIFDLVSVVADALRRQSKDHPLSISIDESVPAVSMDFILMVQVLTNILTNSAKHTPPGTPIQLSVEKIDNGVGITVADAGPGVSPEELPHLFDTFFRGRKAATGGVGLGLSICKGIVEAHGGRIAAYVNRKGGLSINIILPDSLVPRPSRGARRVDMTSVLVVDDEVQIRRLLRVTLEKLGYAVHEAATGSEGLQMVLAKKPDLVLLDLGLPDKDGTAVLAELRSWSTVPVIVLSVRNSEEDIVHLLDAGADDYVIKPFNTGELMARMKVAIRHHAPQEAQAVFATGRLSVDLQEREVKVAGETVKLTPTEYGLLRLFVQHAGRILTHRQLLREVWGPNMDEETNYLRVYITGLRKKIESNPQMPELIITEPGVGYRLRVLPA